MKFSIRHSIFPIVILLFGNAHAQVPIEALDSFATKIRAFEPMDGETSVDGLSSCALSFPEESFGFNYNDGLAWKAVNKTKDGRTRLFITENIDLSKAKSVHLYALGGYDAGTIQLIFPSGSIQTTIYEEGKDPLIIKESIVSFYVKLLDDNEEEVGALIRMYRLLAEVSNAFKVAKGQLTAGQAAQQQQDYITMMTTNDDTHIDKVRAFVAAYPSSIYFMDVNDMLMRIDKAKNPNNKAKTTEEENMQATAFRDSLVSAYKYKERLSVTQYPHYNSATATLISPKNEVAFGHYRRWENELSPGPYEISFTDGVEYRHIILNSEASKKGCQAAYESVVGFLKTNIAEQFIQPHTSISGGQAIHLMHPKGTTCIGYSFFDAGNGNCRATINLAPDK